MSWKGLCMTLHSGFGFVFCLFFSKVKFYFVVISKVISKRNGSKRQLLALIAENVYNHFIETVVSLNRIFSKDTSCLNSPTCKHKGLTYRDKDWAVEYFIERECPWRSHGPVTPCTCQGAAGGGKGPAMWVSSDPKRQRHRTLVWDTGYQSKNPVEENLKYLSDKGFNKVGTTRNTFWIEALAIPAPQSPSWLMSFAGELWGAHVASCGHHQRPWCGLAVVPVDGISEASSWYRRQKTTREKSGWPAQNDSLFHPAQEVRTERPYFSYFGCSYFFTLLLEKCNVPTARLWREDRSCVLGDTRGSRAGVWGEQVLQQPSGLGDLVQRHEPHVPEGPSCHSAIRPDDQVGDAAVAERETGPAFRREVQHPAHGGVEDVGMADEELLAALLPPGVCPWT